MVFHNIMSLFVSFFCYKALLAHSMRRPCSLKLSCKISCFHFYFTPTAPVPTLKSSSKATITSTKCWTLDTNNLTSSQRPRTSELTEPLNVHSVIQNGLILLQGNRRRPYVSPTAQPSPYLQTDFPIRRRRIGLWRHLSPCDCY